MTKIYEVRVTKVTYDWGRFDGYKHIAYTINKAKAEAIAEETKEAIMNAHNDWWITTGKGKDGKPAVEVVELGEVVE